MERRSGLARGIRGSMAAGILILFLTPSVYYLGASSAPNLAVMAALVAMAVHVYRSFGSVLESRAFNLLGPPVIGLAAAGVAALALGVSAGAAAIAAAYWGEPVMGYFIYARLRGRFPSLSKAFLASAAAFAYTVPLVLLGLWEVPFAADLAKVLALAAIYRRLE
ncbi:MAG: hypothetical protein RXR06_09335 [Thermoproteus sp.]|jgi:hypothetical protein